MISEFYIKFLYGFLILSLLFPIQTKASEKIIKIIYQIPYPALSPDNTLYAPPADVVTELADSYTATQAQLTAERLRYGTHKSCVEIAKEYLGIFGTWGSGGRNLSLNSGPVVNAVVIFTYIHVGIIKAVAGDQLLLYEGNYDNHGSIRTRWLAITDPTIKGFHLFPSS